MKVRHYFILSLSALMLVGCTNEDINNTLDEERLPLKLEATLNGGSRVTRAENNRFETKDKLLSFVRHVTCPEGTDIKTETDYTKYTKVMGGLVTFTKGEDAMLDTDTESIKKTSDLSTEHILYWDDFSESSENGAKDLRTPNHGLQSYYGYCYNGTEETSVVLSEDTGILTWLTTLNQSTADALKKNDLLWSQSQKAVVYEHAKNERGTITVPYTHAMSKFTIVVEAKDGFKDGDLKNTIVTLKGVSEVGTFDAPKGEVTASGSIDVTMCPDGNTGATTRTYQAVTVPHTKLEKDKVLATITDAGGNNYEIIITEKMLEAANWGNGLTSGETKSGVNYLLNVKLNKQAISVSATLANWNTVEATGNGEIQFASDVAKVGGNDNSLNDGDSFALWMAEDGAAFGTTATTKAVFSKSEDKFTNEDAIYWPDGNTKFKFRALAEQTSAHTLLAVTTTSIVKDTNSKLPDLLWGTSGEDAIAPRTGDVPLTFSHAMSNVVVKLETSNDDKSKVEIDKATIRITDLITDGTIAISSGDISIGNTVGEVAVDGETIMVPQTISTDAKLIITLADKKTTYSLKLSTIDNITKWVRGNQYTYTIHLEKEEMKFSATIQPWIEKTGSGKADLDWD